MDVVITGFAGLCDFVIMTEKKYEELYTRYPTAFLEEAKRQKVLLWQSRNNLPEEGIATAHFLPESGVFMGL